MTRQTYGILAGMIGTAVGAWWWTRQRARAEARRESGRGTTIYHNTPQPSPQFDEESEGVV